MSIKPVRGLRSYYPTDKGPIDSYQLGGNGRVEYLAAEIATDHLSKGNDTTEEWKKWAKERGVSSDEPGLILPHQLGGIGTDKANLFPKSPLLEKTVWSEHQKTAIEEASEMKKWKKIKFAARLEYPSDDSTRPSTIEYQYDLPSGTILYGKVKNDAAPEDAASEDESGKEESSEYEYEEEEEEAEAEKTIAENKAEPPAEPAKSEEEEEEYEEEEEEETATTTKSSENKVEPAKLPDIPVIKTVVEPPTPPVIEKSPSPPPPPPPQIPNHPTPTAAPVNKPYQAPSAERDESWKRASSPQKNTKSTKEDSKQQNGGGVITKSDLINLLPVIGSCKLAVETVQAAYNGNGKLAVRKAVQCGISLVADFYLGRAVARHGKILANSVTEQAVLRFVTKAENQIIIVSAFKATNQLLSTLTRTLF